MSPALLIALALASEHASQTQRIQEDIHAIACPGCPTPAPKKTAKKPQAQAPAPSHAPAKPVHGSVSFECTAEGMVVVTIRDAAGDRSALLTDEEAAAMIGCNRPGADAGAGSCPLSQRGNAEALDGGGYRLCILGVNGLRSGWVNAVMPRQSSVPAGHVEPAP